MSSVNNRISALREVMKQRGIAAYIAPTGDPHMSEYIAERFMQRKFITGFTGSAGVAVIGQDACALFVDGRYPIQAAKETVGTPFEVTATATALNDAAQWASERGGKAGIDGRLISSKQAGEIADILPDFDLDCRLIEEVWPDAPGMPSGAKVTVMPAEYTGATAREKIAAVRLTMAKDDATRALISSLDDIAWLMNIRGGDVQNTPVVYAYALISKGDARLYVDKSKLTAEVCAYLSDNGVCARDYENIYDDIKTCDKTAYDPARTSASLAGMIENGVEITEYTALPKAIKSANELNGFRSAAVADGVAMVKLLMWVEGQKNLTEWAICEQVNALRFSAPGCVGLSFNPIAGFNANGAMMHYNPTADNCAKIEGDGLLVLDSGGQFDGATTDITRTLVFGDPTPEMKAGYTLALRSHIALMSAIFLKGATGNALDTIARSVVWRACEDYKCGTGHGIGCRLGVHEGPQGMSQRQRQSAVALEPGMLLTVEPGIYKEGFYGVRHENVVCVKAQNVNDSGEYYALEPLTWCPIDVRAIDINAMTRDEISWLNKYHAQVYVQLSPVLDEGERAWLKRATQPIGE